MKFKILSVKKNIGSAISNQRTLPTVDEVTDVRILRILDFNPLPVYVDIKHKDEFIYCGEINSKTGPSRNYHAKAINDHDSQNGLFLQRCLRLRTKESFLCSLRPASSKNNSEIRTNLSVFVMLLKTMR